MDGVVVTVYCCDVAASREALSPVPPCIPMAMGWAGAGPVP